jgi:hypothetical protein
VKDFARLDEVLNAVYMIQVCRTASVATYKAFHPMDAMVGQMDWHWELNRLLEGGPLGREQC